MSNPTGQTGVEGLRADFRKILFSTNTNLTTRSGIESFVIEAAQLCQAHTSAVLDRVEKGMPRDSIFDYESVDGMDGYREALDQFTDLMKKVREEI